MDSGLEHVVAAETGLSDVDGGNGRLIIRGWPVEALAARMSFEDVAVLLWQGLFGASLRGEDIQTELGAARVRIFTDMVAAPERLNAIEALRFGWASLRDGHDLCDAMLFTAAAPVLIAAHARAMQGLSPIAPNPHLSQAADFLCMLRDADASVCEVAALNAYLATICDHGLNASTFAARVAASTQAGLGSAVLAGVSALKGPLHGGAPGPVLDMLDAIGAPENAAAWIDAALARGDRLMGFGHRVYRVRDPRAGALKAALAKLPLTAGRIAFAEHIEHEALSKLAAKYPARSLDINVEFYTALLLEALDIPRESFTCIFAMGRVLGWIAHAREQVSTGRIVRPQSRYVGPAASAAA